MLKAARERLRHEPAHQISLRELARSIGVSHGAPYRHFPQREDFNLALAAYCVREWTQFQEQSTAKLAGRARLIGLGESYVTWAVDNPHAFGLAFDPSLDDSSEPLAGAAAGHRRLLLEVIAGALGGQPGPGSEALASGLWCTVHGAAQLVISGRLQREAVAGIVQAVAPE